MKKKILFVLVLLILLCGNLMVSNSSNDNASFINLENIAYADGESGGGGFDCYDNMITLVLPGGRLLTCHLYPYGACKYEDDAAPYESEGQWYTCSP